MRISLPCSSRHASTGRPSTSVPFLLPRSRIAYASLLEVTAAWRRDTALTSITMSAASRPITISFSSSGQAPGSAW